MHLYNHCSSNILGKSVKRLSIYGCNPNLDFGSESSLQLTTIRWQLCPQSTRLHDLTKSTLDPGNTLDWLNHGAIPLRWIFSLVEYVRLIYQARKTVLHRFSSFILKKKDHLIRWNQLSNLQESYYNQICRQQCHCLRSVTFSCYDIKSDVIKSRYTNPVNVFTIIKFDNVGWN